MTMTVKLWSQNVNNTPRFLTLAGHPPVAILITTGWFSKILRNLHQDFTKPWSRENGNHNIAQKLATVTLVKFHNYHQTLSPHFVT